MYRFRFTLLAALVALAAAPNCGAQTPDSNSLSPAQAAAAAAMQAISQSAPTPTPAPSATDASSAPVPAADMPSTPVPGQDLPLPATPSAAFTGAEAPAASADATAATSAPQTADDPMDAAMPVRRGQAESKPASAAAKPAEEKPAATTRKPDPTPKPAARAAKPAERKPATARASAPKPASRPTPKPDSAAALREAVMDQMSLGTPTAPFVIVEYADLQCPDSRRFEQTILPEVRREYVDTGLVRYEVRALPLDKHPQALAAEQAARLAGEQGRYWEMRSRLMSHQNDLSEPSVLADAQALGLDMTKFESGARAGRWLQEIMNERNGAAASGIQRTPTLVVARVEADGGTVPVASVVEPRDYRSLKRTLDRAMGRAASPATGPRRGLFGARSEAAPAPVLPASQPVVMPAQDAAAAAVGMSAPVRQSAATAADALEAASGPLPAAATMAAPAPADTGLQPGGFRPLVATPAPDQPSQPKPGLLDALRGRK